MLRHDYEGKYTQTHYDTRTTHARSPSTHTLTPTHATPAPTHSHTLAHTRTHWQ